MTSLSQRGSHPASLAGVTGHNSVNSPTQQFTCNFKEKQMSFKEEHDVYFLDGGTFYVKSVTRISKLFLHHENKSMKFILLG